MSKPAYSINWDHSINWDQNSSALISRAEVESMLVSYNNVIAQKSGECESLRAVIHKVPKPTDINVTLSKLSEDSFVFVTLIIVGGIVLVKLARIIFD